MTGTINFIGHGDARVTPEEGASVLEEREPHPSMAADPNLPDDTRLWAALQAVSGGTWRGSVYDVDRIIAALEAGLKTLGNDNAI
ncbi:putative dehydratase [compost metagenome]